MKNSIFLFIFHPPFYYVHAFQIKTLRLATSYITYLTRVLEGDQDPSSGFRAELVPSSRKINAERRAKCEAQVSKIQIPNTVQAIIPNTSVTHGTF